MTQEYVEIPHPTDSQLTNLSYKLKHLEMRCNTLGGDRDPQIDAMLPVIRGFKAAVQNRFGEEANQRQNAPKPYVFKGIFGPTMRDGGHTPKGAEYLRREVDEFIEHYRALEDTKYSRNEVYLDSSRSYFRGDIEGSIQTAVRRIKDPKPEDTYYVSRKGRLVFDNYSPQENLQWALSVALIATYFESELGGSAAEWDRWKQKIQAVADANHISLE